MKRYTFCIVCDYEAEFHVLEGATMENALEVYFYDQPEHVFGCEKKDQFGDSAYEFIKWVKDIIESPSKELAIYTLAE